MSPEERKTAGAELNALKTRVAEAIETKNRSRKRRSARLATETVDVTLLCFPPGQGRIHPVSQVTEEIIAIFFGDGF
ncbi:MAG: hypothetical protein R3C60_07520 [Parvularculaceae bacterium]